MTTISHANVELPTDRNAPRMARRVLRDLTGIPAERMADVELLVSELVANSVKHGPDLPRSIEMRVWVARVAMRVEVQDGGRGFEVDDALASSVSSMGLRIVDRIADRWGIDTGPATTAWFEIDFDQGA
jgi:anti-sigma regulatory factor (Ser/Thr protein kinase)